VEALCGGTRRNSDFSCEGSSSFNAGARAFTRVLFHVHEIGVGGSSRIDLERIPRGRRDHDQSRRIIAGLPVRASRAQSVSHIGDSRYCIEEAQGPMLEQRARARAFFRKDRTSPLSLTRTLGSPRFFATLRISFSENQRCFLSHGRDSIAMRAYSR